MVQISKFEFNQIITNYLTVYVSEFAQRSVHPCDINAMDKILGTGQRGSTGPQTTASKVTVKLNQHLFKTL